MLTYAPRPTHAFASCPVFCALGLLLAGCGDGGGSTSTGTLTPPDGCLTPGTDDQTTVQTALIEVADGGTVCLAEGTFKFTGELSLAVDNVTVRGAGQGKTILDFSGQTSGANGFTITSDGVTIEGFEVHDTPGDGIRATSVNDITFQNVTVLWSAPASVDNGAYGLYPVGCDRVRIDGCIVSGARDAGIYVGQSTHILVVNSEAYGNVAGCEIENSTDSEVRDNYFHDNTGGFLAFNLPNLPVQDGKRAKVHHNRIVHNNLQNFAEPGTMVAVVPPGTGIVVLASDANEFHDNEITGNKSTGFMMLSYSDLVGMYSDPDFNEFPQSNFVHHNMFADNGTDPDVIVKTVTNSTMVSDMIWDGCEDPNAMNTMGALTNCFFENAGATYTDFKLCAMGTPPSTDLMPVTCEHTALAAQDP